MPVIEYFSPHPSPPDDFLQDVCRQVQALIQLPDNHVWAFWHQIKQNCYFKPSWQNLESPAAPFVKVRCKSSYTQEQVHALTDCLAKQICQQFSVPLDEPYILVDRVLPHQLFVRGQLWEGQHLTDLEEIIFQVIGVVHNERNQIEDDHWDGVISEIHLNKHIVHPKAICGLEEFSHLEVIYFMHLVPLEKVITDARRPRNIEHLPEIGILAQRPKARPNRIGLSRCKLLDVDGLVLRVQSLDAIDGTPVIDIKPYFKNFAPRGEVCQPEWVSEIMQNYYL